MLNCNRAVTALTLAVGSAVLAACQTTPQAPPSLPSGTHRVVLTAAQFALVQAAVREELAEPTGAYFVPNPGAIQGGAHIAVCGLLNGSNAFRYVNDAVYVVYLDYSQGERAEVIAIGGPASHNRELRAFCNDELGITFTE